MFVQNRQIKGGHVRLPTQHGRPVGGRALLTTPVEMNVQKVDAGFGGHGVVILVSRPTPVRLSFREAVWAHGGGSVSGWFVVL